MDETEQGSRGREPYRGDTEASEEELLEGGWQRRFVSEEPRLSESVEMYESLGFEVKLRLLVEADLSNEDCTECFKTNPSHFRVIYTRKAKPNSGM
ncbi:MAG: hypothetical protein ACYTFG_00820 [Planctomycetota bacterium]|jgi:hypothetical protein